jgi:hypothetical protein
MKFFVKLLNVLGIAVVALSWVVIIVPGDADKPEESLLSAALALLATFIGCGMIVFAANLKRWRETQEADQPFCQPMIPSKCNTSPVKRYLIIVIERTLAIVTVIMLLSSVVLGIFGFVLALIPGGILLTIQHFSEEKPK